MSDSTERFNQLELENNDHRESLRSFKVECQWNSRNKKPTLRQHQQIFPPIASTHSSTLYLTPLYLTTSLEPNQGQYAWQVQWHENALSRIYKSNQTYCPATTSTIFEWLSSSWSKWDPSLRSRATLVCSIGWDIITTVTQFSYLFGRVRRNIWGYELSPNNYHQTLFSTSSYAFSVRPGLWIPTTSLWCLVGWPNALQQFSWGPFK
jgi:hypothetical protein